MALSPISGEKGVIVMPIARLPVATMPKTAARKYLAVLVAVSVRDRVTKGSVDRPDWFMGRFVTCGIVVIVSPK